MSKVPNLFQRLSQSYKAYRLPWKTNVLVGVDLDGNEYWEMPSPLGRNKRWVQMKDHDDYAVYNQNLLPVQWQAWLRHTRFEAPSVEELVKEQYRRQLIQQRAMKLDQEWEQRKINIQKQKEEMARLEHAAADQNKKDSSSSPLSSTEPSGQGDTFVPGEWKPVGRR